jgi:hypothetical protein
MPLFPGLIALSASGSLRNIASRSFQRSLAVFGCVLALALNAPVLGAQATAPALSLGSVNVGGNATGTVTFTFSAQTTVSSISVVTKGATGLDFQPGTPAATGACTATTYSANATCTVAVTFNPLYPGGRLGAVLLATSSPAGVSTAYISGTGVGPLALFQPGVLTTTFSTSLNAGRGVAVDGAGNVYVNESGGSAIDKFTPAGVETQLAATNGTGGTVDGAGNYFFGSGSGVYELPGGAPGTPVLVASGFGVDNNLSVDGAGNLYGSTYPNPVVGTIFELSANTYTYTALLTGNGTKRFIGLVSDVAGNVYTADFNNNVLYELPAGATSFTTLATGSPLASPHAVLVDAAGDIYVGNDGGSTIFRYSAGRYAVATLAVQGSLGLAMGGDGSIYTMAGNATLYGYTRATNPPVAFPATYTAGLNSATVTQENDGNAPLTYTVPASGLFNPSLSNAVFTSDAATTCPQLSGSSSAATLAPAATCNDVIDFNPPSGSATNSYTGTLSIQDNSLNVASTQTASLTASGTSPDTTITLGVSPGGTQAYATSQTLTATVSPSSSSGTVIFYSNGAALGSSVTVAGGVASATYTTLPLGTDRITAVFTGSAASTTSNTVIVTITQAPQTITFPQPPSPAYASSTATLTATSSSGLAVTYSILSGPATLSGSTVTYTATGNVVIAADQAGNGNYQAAPEVTNTVVVQPPPAFTVTVTTDPTSGTASNCSNQALSGAMQDASCSLRDAIAAVNAAAITGTTAPQPVINFASGLFGRTITVTAELVLAANVNIAGPGPGSTLTLSGGGTTRILGQTKASTATTVSGLTFTGGYSNVGGAFLGNVASSTYNFTNDIFSANVYSGANSLQGALDLTDAPAVTIAGCSFLNNKLTGTSAVEGGAFFQSGGSLSIRNSPQANTIFSGNLVQGTGNVYAGALYTAGLISGGLTISGASFVGNSATSSGTTSSVYGGAAFISSINTAYVVSITNTLFSGNTGAGQYYTYGGALYLSSGVLTSSDSTFTGNTVTYNTATNTVPRYGGAIYSSTGTTLYNDTVTGNSALGGNGRGGGVYSAGASTAYNTVISGNTASTADRDELNVAAGSNNYIDTSLTLTCTANCAPLLSVLGSYGGPTQTSLPLPGSPLLAAGTTARLNGANTDARGMSRTLTEAGATHVDIGATEANYSLAFVQQPASIETGQPQISTVQLSESNNLFAPGVAAGTLGLADAAGVGTGSTAMSASGLETLTETYTGAATGDTLTAAVQTSGNVTLASVTSGTFNVVNAATATFASLQLSTFPTPSATGIAQTITLTALDNGGAPYAAYTGTITFTSSDPSATLPAPYTFTAADAGVHTFSITLNTGGLQSITATDGSSTVTETGIVTTGYIGVLSPSGDLSSFYGNGTAISPSGGFIGGGTPTSGLAIDASGDYFSVDSSTNVLTEFSRTGAPLSGSGYTGGGLNSPAQVAVDGLGRVWITNNNGSLSEFTNAGTAISPATGYKNPDYLAPSGITIDVSGNVWVANTGANTVTEVLGGAAPVAPLSTSITNATTGSRP